jgi:hypothetical protein
MFVGSGSMAFYYTAGLCNPVASWEGTLRSTLFTGAGCFCTSFQSGSHPWDHELDLHALCCINFQADLTASSGHLNRLTISEAE